MSVEKPKVVIKEKRRPRPNRLKQAFKEFAWTLLAYAIAMVLVLKDKLTEIVLGSYLGDKKACPSLTSANRFLEKSAVDLARSIRTGEITSTQLVQAIVDRIKEVNKLLNAVVDGPFDDALDEARRIDERIAKKQIGDAEFAAKPFLGVPFTTKDSTCVAGKLHTLGLLARRNTTAKEDADCVARAKAAGAIIIATTNIPEVNKWQETRNNLIGQTNNPYDTRRTVGGSSGGEAALLTSCGTCFGLGTDIGGSIRMPAFYCGIFGHKPTVGAVNTRGCTFRTGEEKSTMVVAGPMSRHARDLLPLLKVLADPRQAKELRLDEPVDVRRLKFYYMKESGEMKTTPVSGELQTAMSKAIDHFENLTGRRPVEIKLHGTDRATKLWRYWMTQEPADFNKLLGNGTRLNAFVELAKKLTFTSNYTMASIYSLIDEILPKEKADKIREITRQCDEDLTNILGDDGILLYHNMTRTAPFHYALLFNVSDFSYWSIFNVLHVPATQVPVGLDSNGLPLGIQVVSTRNRDRHCIAVAEELEKAFGGWRAPF